jgi:hypothetical protein
MVNLRRPGIAVIALTLLLSSASLIATSHIDLAPLPRETVLARLWAPDEKPLVQYKALRHITASTRGGRMSASMEAWTSLDEAGRFSFEIVSESGSSLIRQRVLKAALEAEQASQTPGAREQAALTIANYEFLEMRPDSEHLLKIDIKPKRKHVMLVDGALFVEEETADLVRIEGELPKRPSFWTRRVRVVREYKRIDGVHVPVAMSSTADVLVVGRSTFSMTYDYSEINRKVVSK